MAGEPSRTIRLVLELPVDDEGTTELALGLASGSLLRAHQEVVRSWPLPIAQRLETITLALFRAWYSREDASPQRPQPSEPDVGGGGADGC